MPVPAPLGEGVPGPQVGVQMHPDVVLAGPGGLEAASQGVRRLDADPRGVAVLALQHLARSPLELRPLAVLQQEAVEADTGPIAEVPADDVPGIPLGGGGVGVAAVHVVARERVAELGAHAPGAVPHAEGVDLDQLVADPQRARVAAGLIEVALAESVGRADALEGEVHLDLRVVGIEVVELVASERLHAAIADAVGELEVGEVRARGEGQVPEVLGIEAVPDVLAGLVPEECAARGHALVGAEEGVELARDPSLGAPRR